jgi:general secretion pathway protein D
MKQKMELVRKRYIYIEDRKMKRSKSIILVLVGVAVVLILWGIAVYPPASEQPNKPAEASATDPNKPIKTGQPADANKPAATADANEPARPPDANKPENAVAAGNEPNKPADSNEPMEALNLNDVPIKDIFKKLADWTGKTIIPDEESKKLKVTIYSPDKLPRSKALAMIYATLRMKGFVAEFADGAIFIKPIAQAKLGEVPTIASDYPLAMIENKEQVVQKFFKLKNYGPSQMGQILMPLIGEYGYVSADENTGSLAVIDTVKNLMRIELLIEQYDVVEAADIDTRIFDIKYGDPSEIVSLLKTLLSKGYVSSPSGGGSSGGGPKDKNPGKGGGAVTTVTIGTSRTPAMLIPETTHKWIIAKATAKDMEQIAGWIDKLDKAVPTILVDYPLSEIENKNQVVQRFFRLKNYGSAQMADIITPLLTNAGHLTADQNTRTLFVVDTVQNLINLKGIIEQFDVPEAEQAQQDIFEIYYGDPAEIVQVLRMLLSFDGTGSGSSGRDRSRYGGSYSYGRDGRASYASSGGGSSPVTGTGQVPIVLIPEPTRKWIIARASAEDMKKITEWIEKLDKQQTISREHETITLGYANVSEVAQRLNEAIQRMPGTELQASVLVQPLIQARQILIFGRPEMREMVKKMIAEIDVPTGMFETKVFKLNYADPDKIKENLEGLYEQEAGYSYSYGYSYSGYSRSSRNVETQDTVRIISFSTMDQITVIASPENMLKIEKQIKEWDIPLDLDQVQPRILTLRNSDPVQMAGLLTRLFSERESSSRDSFYRYIFGFDEGEKKKIVGPLFGQLTFEAVPGTKKIIVISNIAGAYEVVGGLVTKLDSQEIGEVPEVIELKYADPEDLTERLNALFVTPGQQARIRLTKQGLTGESAMSTTDDNNAGSNNAPQTNNNEDYTPPWSGAGARIGIGVNEEMPISNIIGRVRFVPEPHTKSIMVLSPPEFIEDIRKMINRLDVPGKQVVIEAIIVEVDHSKVTSLGIELSTNPQAFGALSENAIVALGNLTTVSRHGSAVGTISASQGVAATGSGSVLGVGTDVYALIDFLIKTTNAKVLNQQTLWTKDNEQANFFKGSEVAFQGSESITQQTTTQNVKFEKVGMELRARPSITPEDNVDMIVNVKISQLTSELVNDQPVRTSMETTTNMIVQDGQTLLLGGILFQTDSRIEHKIPLFGDVPLVGGLFRHNEAVMSNNEMFVFMTPHVIAEPGAAKSEAEQSQQKLKEIRKGLNSTLEGLSGQTPDDKSSGDAASKTDEAQQQAGEPEKAGEK